MGDTLMSGASPPVSAPMPPSDPGDEYPDPDGGGLVGGLLHEHWWRLRRVVLRLLLVRVVGVHRAIFHGVRKSRRP
ncbi:hypothetical protein AB0J20_16275 [Micromonospora costi]|uniref:hypothetical protein n=1 Tax=Micromonospora costi TaxID=1530042 RepID=UPI00340E3881